MTELNVCPSTLQEGYSTYSPMGLKQLFDGQPVSHILDFDSPNNESADSEAYLRSVGRISLSGVQPKASLVVNSSHQLVKPCSFILCAFRTQVLSCQRAPDNAVGIASLSY